MNDERVDTCSQELVNTIEVCHKAENIRTLMDDKENPANFEDAAYTSSQIIGRRLTSVR